MTERIPRIVLVAGAIAVPIVLVLFAYLRPGYVTSELYVGGLLFVEFMIAAIWMFREVFFPLVLMAFLFSGLNLHVGSFWTVLRWVILAIGALVGIIVMLRDGRYRLRLFHFVALFAVLAALVSAAVSRYPSFAALKALSLFLLFVYCATGVRAAVAGRENRFFSGLLLGCEVLVSGITAGHLVGIEVMGNPNSLGAITGVVASPILLWGAMLEDSNFIRRRRLVLFGVCMFLVFYSLSRAGIAAAVLSCTLLCLCLRQYRMFILAATTILIVAATTAIFWPEAASNGFSSVTSSVVYKGRDSVLGVFASRQSPWQNAMDTIRTHFWFGTGFGTTDNGAQANAPLSAFSTDSSLSVENGSSFLAITTWVGMLGVLPFFLLLLILLGKVFRTMVWMLQNRSPLHPAVPLAMVMISGLVNAAFEDWLFAPGYYLCVFFWSMAFLLVDLEPAAPLFHARLSWRPSRVAEVAGSVAPGR
ncbi:MAG TPA: O-antigen ligase family protein [Candidatus Solibacter sp.]|nr:O-antigen ligase family protein [Candidatus Solibacter sp.]